MRNVFITGATGFLGRYILKALLDSGDIGTAYVLARGKKGESAKDRMRDVLIYLYGANGYKAKLEKVKIIEGEIENGSLGMDKRTRDRITNEIDEIYHSAAIAEFRVPLDLIRRSNVIGAENIFKLAMECKKSGRFKRVNHISTTFVAGTKTGIFYEDSLDVGQKFNNTYEQTKFEAELLAHEYRDKGLDITIFRPSILTGDYSSGKTSNFKMLYQPLHFFASELFDAVPADIDTKENLIPVDTAAEEICSMAGEKNVENKTFNIANPATITIGHFFNAASDFFGFKKPEFIPAEKFDMKRLTPVQRNLFEPYMPYFNYKIAFDSAKAQAVLKKKMITTPAIDDEFLLKLFGFCRTMGFIKSNSKVYAN